MKQTCIHVLILALIASACTQAPAQISISETPTIKAPITFTPSLTYTASSTTTATSIPPTRTPTPSCDCTLTPTPTRKATKRPTGELPGVMIRGAVTAPNKMGIAGVQVYYALSAYPGNLLATTDAQGQYDGFIYIPQDETVRVWVEYTGYLFRPGEGNRSWINGEFAWHHYGGYENVNLSFIGTPE